jgi:hypothetical protein
MTRPWTDTEVLETLKSDGPWNRARREFSAACGRIEQAGQQRDPLSPIDLRRMEFEAVESIIGAFGSPVERVAARNRLASLIGEKACKVCDLCGAGEALTVQDGISTHLDGPCVAALLWAVADELQVPRA